MEEISRTVRRKEKHRKKERSSRHHSASGEHHEASGASDRYQHQSSGGHYHHSRHRRHEREAITSGHEQRNGGPWTQPFGTSPYSPWRTPSVVTNESTASGSLRYRNQDRRAEAHHAEEASRHQAERSAYFEGNRRGGGGHRIHKSHSARDVYNGEIPPDYDDPSGGRNPIVEFPPTLPREGFTHKANSYADWNEYKAHENASHAVERQNGQVAKWWKDDGTSHGLEREYHDSLLMPMPRPGQNVEDHDYRENPIPGGKETLARDVQAKTEQRPGGEEVSTTKHSVSYKKEQTVPKSRRI